MINYEYNTTSNNPEVWIRIKPGLMYTFVPPTVDDFELQGVSTLDGQTRLIYEQLEPEEKQYDDEEPPEDPDEPEESEDEEEEDA